MTQNTNDIFNEEFARQYDAYNGKHQPIADNLHPQRAGIYQQMQQQLKPGGRLVTAEIAGDVQDTGFDEQLLFWKTMHESASGRAQNLDEMKQMLTQRLLLLPAAQTEALMAQAGFTPPQRFFQSLLIHGWTARKR